MREEDTPSHNDEITGGVGWSAAEAHTVRWNDLLGDFVSYSSLADWNLKFFFFAIGIF